MVLENRLAAGEFHVHGGRDAANLELDGDRQPLAVVLPRYGDGDHQPPVAAERLEPDVRRADRHVALRGGGVGEQLDPDLLREFREGIADPAPGAVVGLPVVGPLIGADPDLGRSRRVLANEVVAALEQGWQVGRRRDRSGRGEFHQRRRRRHLLGPLRRIAHHEHATSPKRGQRVGKLPASRVELRLTAGRRDGLHARGAIEHHDCGVGTAATGKRQPAARERPADGEDHRRHGEHPQRHDQPVPQPRVTPRERLGREQKLHRRPPHRLEPPLVDEVNDQRQGHQRQRHEHPRLEERHRSPLPAARPTRNLASTCS